MSDGNRHNRLPDSLGAPLWIAVAFSFVVIVFLIGDELGVHSGRDQVTAREHYEQVKQDELSACLGIDGSAARKCVIDAIEAAQEQSDSRQDLYAQQGMAKWAFWMLLLSGAGVSITGVGVYYVALTLSEARVTTRAALIAAKEAANTTVAAKQANEIMRADQRPWVTLEREIPCDFNIDGDTGNCSWKYQLINRGKLPAQKVSVKQKLIRYDEIGAGKLFREFGEFTKYNKGVSRLRTGPVVFPIGQPGAVNAKTACLMRFESPGEKYALMVSATYDHPDGVGVDAQLFTIKPDASVPIGPRRHRLISLSFLRIIE